MATVRLRFLKRIKLTFGWFVRAPEIDSALFKYDGVPLVNIILMVFTMETLTHSRSKQPLKEFRIADYN